MKKVAITGLDGFIARHTIQEAKKRGYKVVGNLRHSRVNNEVLDDVNIYYTDIRDKAGVYGMIEHCDGVIHLAGLLGTAENIRQAEIMNEVNVGGALNVLNACDNFQIPCVMIGVGNYFELNTYSISKTTAERYALMYAKNFGTPVNIVRALNAIGTHQKWGKINKILPTFINKALRGEDITIYGGKENCSVMDLVWAGDVAKVLIEVLEMTDQGKAKGEIFEAGTGVGYKVFEIAEMVVDMVGSSSKLVEAPMRYGESVKSEVVAKHPFPIEYRGLKDVISEAIDYYRKLYEAEKAKEFSFDITKS